MPSTSTLVRTLASVVVLAALAAGFAALLQWRERARLAQLAEMRATAPQAWLDEMRWREGFASYLEAVRDLRHFDAWRDDAPLILIGRWAREAPGTPGLRSALEDRCRDGYVFEDGRLRRFGATAFKAPARYRIDEEGRIRVRTASQEWILRPDPNGPALRHLRLRGPDGVDADLVRCG